MTTLASFWLTITVFVAAECVLTLHGIDTFFWKFKTPPELAIQQNLGKCNP